MAIAVVSWNTRDLLARCLASMAPEVQAGRAEVWVVDNESTDGSPALVRERFPWARLLEPGSNLGFGAAVNLVAKRTDSAWLAPANADVELHPGALDELLRASQRHPGAAVLAPRLLLPDGRTQHSVHPFPTIAFTTLFNLGIHRLNRRLAEHLCLEGYWDPQTERTIDWAIGAFLLVRRAAWDEVGGFGGDQWMYAEDLDLGWRLARAGWSTTYVPSAHIGHHSGASTSQAWGKMVTAQWTTSTYAWMLRRRGTAITRVVAVANVVGATVRFACFAVAARLRPARWGATRDAMREWATLHMVGLSRRESLLRHR